MRMRQAAAAAGVLLMGARIREGSRFAHPNRDRRLEAGAPASPVGNIQAKVPDRQNSL